VHLWLLWHRLRKNDSWFKLNFFVSPLCQEIAEMSEEEPVAKKQKTIEVVCFYSIDRSNITLRFRSDTENILQIIRE